MALFRALTGRRNAGAICAGPICAAVGLAVATLFLLSEPDGSAAWAQANCKPTTVDLGALGDRPIDLYATDRRYVRTVEARLLGARLSASDCGDQIFLLTSFEGRMMLVRRSALTTTSVESACVCPSEASNTRRNDLSSPGAGQTRYCPRSQCGG